MTDYLCVTVVGKSGESESEFKGRLSEFWTHMLRNRPDDYERVYSESKEFDTHGDRPTRQYIAEAGVMRLLTAELTVAGLDFLPVDEDEIYSKYEASSSDWFQIEH